MERGREKGGRERKEGWGDRERERKERGRYGERREGTPSSLSLSLSRERLLQEVRERDREIRGRNV